MTRDGAICGGRNVGGVNAAQHHVQVGCALSCNRHVSSAGSKAATPASVSNAMSSVRRIECISLPAIRCVHVKFRCQARESQYGIYSG